MTDGPSKDLIRYDILTQDAMRDVVKKVISEAAKAGLPGDHHFFVSFLTGFPGVKLSARMRERYPDEMTIVIQHQFWDLKATDSQFEIGLSFDEIPETLSIPFAAIKGFFDPSVQFGLQFDVEEDETEDAEITSLATATPRVVDPVQKSEPANEATTTASKSKKPKISAKNKKKDAKPDSNESADEGGGAEVVSLDAFRKKP